MDEKILLNAINLLRETKKIEYLNLHYPGKELNDGSVVYLLDTYSGKDNTPWLSFYVTIKLDLFSPNILPIDKDAKIPNNMDLDKKHILRVAFTIFLAYKDACEKLHKPFKKP